MCGVGQIFPSFNQLKARSCCEQLVDHVCCLVLEQLRRKELVAFDVSWSVWTLHLPIVTKIGVMVRLEVVKRQMFLGEKHVQGQTVILKTCLEFVHLLVVVRTVKQKWELGVVSLSKTVLLVQVKKTLLIELEQKDMSDMEIVLAKARRQELGTEMLYSRMHEWETKTECLSLEEEKNGDMRVQNGEQRDGSMAHLKVGEQRDGLVPEREVFLEQDDDRVKRALLKLHSNEGHPEVKEMSWMENNDCASELTTQKAQQMHCDGRAVSLFALHFIARVLGLMNYDACCKCEDNTFFY